MYQPGSPIGRRQWPAPSQRVRSAVRVRAQRMLKQILSGPLTTARPRRSADSRAREADGFQTPTGGACFGMHARNSRTPIDG